MLNRRRLLLGGTALAAAAVASIPLATSALSRTPATGAKAGEEVVAWLKANALPLATTEPGSGFHDLEPLRPILSKARIVSLGEATHGTREFFTLKHRLIEYCVAELGFTIIAFEANYGAMLAVNDYVLHGRGNATDAVAGQRLAIHDTEEVLALVEWVRAWNLAHERKVKFHGFDMQTSAPATLHLLAYLERVAPELAAASERDLAPLVTHFTFDGYRRLSPSVREIVSAQIKAVIDAFETGRTRWVQHTSAIEWQLARQSAVMLEQYTRMPEEITPAAFAVRDRAMAENVRALLEAEGPGARALLWAHNGHVKRSEGYDFVTLGVRFDAATMGSFLHAMFGAEHVVVGFAFNQGGFRAWGGNSMDTHVVGPAPDGLLDAVLAATGVPLFALDLARVPANGPVAKWMASKPAQRMIGGGFVPKYEHNMNSAGDPRDNYDAILFVERTTAARGNPTPPDRSTAPAANEEPTNLALAGSNGIPKGWSVIDASFYPNALYPYGAVVADDPSPKGGRAVRIARADSTLPWGHGALSQSFPAAPWRGRRLILSAAIRADAPRIGTGAQLAVHVRNGRSDEDPVLLALQPDGPVRSSDWTRRSVAVDIPADAERIQISLAFTGNGAGWFGDIELESTDSAHPVTAVTHEAHKQETIGVPRATRIPAPSPWSVDLWR
jgi:erythromycin esterase